jgi:hypothetical protein
MFEDNSDAANIPTFLREMAARCRARSQNCFDLAAAQDLRLLADDLDLRAAAFETKQT